MTVLIVPDAMAPDLRRYVANKGRIYTTHASQAAATPTLVQLRFASFAVINLREDLHLQECARAGRTKKSQPRRVGFSFISGASTPRFKQHSHGP
jgi:hypothetical protein